MFIQITKTFLYSSSVYSCHLLLISSASVRLIHTISVFYCSPLCMKYSLGISNFLEEISSLSCSVVFLYFFALISEEGFLISPCYSLELCIQMLYLTFPPLLFTFLPRSKRLLISWLQSPSAVILEPQKIPMEKKCKKAKCCLGRPYKEL